ncbi:hypothetical protein ACFL96_11075 [Thermoproteota archaeon]
MPEKEEIQFSVSECKTKAATAVKPVKKIKLDLDKIRKNFEIVLDTDILLVIRKEDEIIIHNYGELLFKTMTDEDKIRKIARKIYEVGA